MFIRYSICIQPQNKLQAQTPVNRIFVIVHITLKSIKQTEKQASFRPEMRSSRVTGEA